MVLDFGLYGFFVCLLYIYMVVNKVIILWEVLGFIVEFFLLWNCS